MTIGRSIVARWTDMGRGLRILFVVNTILLFAARAIWQAHASASASASESPVVWRSGELA